MIRKILGTSLLAVIGLTLAGVCLGAESMVEWEATHTTAMIGWVATIFSDWFLLFALAGGIAFTFIILPKAIGLAKRVAR